ncbi:putative signal transducing protein [Bacteroidota bacterium]
MKEHSTHVRLFTGSFIAVQRLQLDLNDAEIPFLVKNNNESARLGGYGSLSSNVELFIFKEDLEKATEILETLNAEKK